MMISCLSCDDLSSMSHYCTLFQCQGDERQEKVTERETEIERKRDGKISENKKKS